MTIIKRAVLDVEKVDDGGVDMEALMAPATSLAEAVEHIEDDLDRAARGQDVAYHLSGALDQIRRHHTHALRIDAAAHDLLLAAIEDAGVVAARALPPDYSRERLEMGMQAASDAVSFWSSPPEARADTSRSQRADTVAWVRILQNDMYSLSLLDEIAARAR